MEKRSISEKILPKASHKRFYGLPFMIPLPGETKRLEDINKIENSNELSCKVKDTNKTGLGEDNNENQNLNNATKQSPFVLKKTSSAFHINGLNALNYKKDAIKPLPVRNEALKNDFRISKSPKNEENKERFTHTAFRMTNLKKHMDHLENFKNKENLSAKDPQFVTAHKMNNRHHDLKASFKINPKEKIKNKRNIISFDPIMKRELNKKSVPADLTAANLPKNVRKEDYMDLLLENMILKEKCKDNDNFKKILFDKMIKDKIGDSSVKEKQFQNPAHQINNSEENTENPLFLLTQGLMLQKNNADHGRVYQTPDPKNNCYVNYINNNYHLNFVSPIKKESRKTTNPKMNQKVEDNGWKDRIAEYLQKNKNKDLFKKKADLNNNQGNIDDVLNDSRQTGFFNHNSSTNKGSNIRTKKTERKNPDKPFKTSKIKIPVKFLEDSTTNKEDDHSSGREDPMACTPVIKNNGPDGKCDTLNFTFSNFKQQP